MATVRIGDPIPLSLQLFDGDETKFVRAIVRDALGVELTGSPKTLTHISDGKYEDTSILFPSIQFVTATFQVFNDAAFTTPSPDHSDSVDQIDVLVVDADLLEKLLELKELIEALIAGGVAVGTTLAGQVDQSTTLDGKVEDGDSGLTGDVSDSGVTLEGEIDEATPIEGELAESDALEGDLDE